MTTYTDQLNAKHQHLQQLFAGIPMPEWQIHPSPEHHHRMRAEFRIWHNNEQLHYAMFRTGEKASTASLIPIEQLPAADAAINALMPRLMQAIAREPILRTRWYQCEFLATQSGQMLVSLIYHKKLDETWTQAATQLHRDLNIFIIGRSRGQKIIIGQDWVEEQFTINGHPYRYRQPEGGFTQPNATVCQKMLHWATQAAQNLGGDLLELYCGNGNFTLPLSRCFNRVLATELAKTSVAAAQWNIQTNNIDNIQIARLSAEEFTQAWTGIRPFRRLQEANIQLQDYQFSTVFVDPPRAGIDPDTLQLLSRFDNIIYISCNPQTLRRDLDALLPSHQIEQAALFDQFPFTPHIESGLLLRRRPSAQSKSS